MAERKKQNLIEAASVLVAATLIVKLIGAIYKIPLGSLIGATGYGYFQKAYELYTPIYTISMAGLPIAVSRMVSENIALNRFRQADQVFKVSKRIFFFIGLFGTLLMLAVAYPYSKYLIMTEKNLASVIAIAPCVFFCCIMSSYRGFYEGTRNMIPTGISQVIEAVGKVAFGLVLAFATMKYGMSLFEKGATSVFGVPVSSEAEALSAIYPYAAAAAILGVTIGSLCGMVYMLVLGKLKGSFFTREELVNSPEPLSSKDTAKDIIRIAIPIALSSVVVTLTNFIDTVMVNNLLDKLMDSSAGIITGLYADSIALDHVITEDIPTYLYGAYGFALNLKNLAPYITLNLGVVVIPILAEAWSLKNKQEVKKTVESVLRLTMFIAMPAGLGMAALSKPIMQLLYGAKNPGTVAISGPILFVCALPMFLYSLSSPLTNMLNAVDKMKEPLKAVIIGAVVKIGLNYVLISNPKINIMGAPYSSLASYAAMVGYCYFALIRTTKVKVNYFSVFVKPLFAATLCGATAYFSYLLLTSKLSLGNSISCLASICCGGVVYIVIYLLIKGFAKDDVEMLPKGEKIAKVLEKMKLLG